MPVSCYFRGCRGCKAPLSRIVSGAISSERAPLPLPFNLQFTPLYWFAFNWDTDTYRINTICGSAATSGYSPITMRLNSSRLTATILMPTLNNLHNEREKIMITGRHLPKLSLKTDLLF